jgi:two-component system cell cycle sensor histidine kinase/response regulator CckA
MASRTAPGSAETLLIVDDEEMLVELLRRMLVRQGYRVIAARTGEEALALYAQHRAEIDLVITDLVMPGMDGRMLAEELLRRDPDVRILVSTGFSAQSDITSLLEGGIRGVVMKPYQSKLLYAGIREALDT